MYKVGDSRRRQLWVRGLIVFVILGVLVAGGAVVAARRYYVGNLEPVSSSQTPVEIIVPPGSTLATISDMLQQKSLIRNRRVFEQYVRNQGLQDKLQAGTYSLRPSLKAQEIVEVLTQGHIQKQLFTVLPAQRLDQIKSAMINAGFNAQEVEQALDPAQYKDHPALVDKPAGASLEGYLYPESFQKTNQTKPATIVRQSLDEMQEHLTPSLRAALVAQGLTVHQAITLSSIVEREVSRPEDRRMVAQVFLRRMREGKKLESDATTAYGAILAGDKPSVSYESAYNTYIHAGLPPGPISNTSEVSLQSVASPSATDWLYFVAGDDGKTHFSHTLEEHQELTRQYCKRLCNGL